MRFGVEKFSKRHFWRVSLVGLSSLLLTSCTETFLTVPGSSSDQSNAAGFANGALSGRSISIDAVRSKDPQHKLGAREHPKILSLYGGSYENSEAEKMLALIVGRLVETVDEPQRAFEITLLNSPSVNAFALPGGYIYVTRGLLALANDSSELAAVIAHEMGHVAANHGVLRNEKEKDVTVTGRVVREVLSRRRTGLVALPRAEKLKLAQFSRNQELEADALGVEIAAKAGFDPHAQARYLKSMQRFTKFKSGRNVGAASGGLDFLATHPSAPQRIQLAANHAKKFGAGGESSRDRVRYLKGIEGLLFGNSAEEGFVRGVNYYHTTLKVAFSVPENFMLENRKEAIVAAGPKQMAIRVDAAPLAPRKSLIGYLNSGWIGGLTPTPPQPKNINGLEALHGQAAADGWVFDITLIRHGDRVYRVIAAAPAGVSQISAVGAQTAATFRLISEAEAADILPLKIKIHTVSQGENFANLAKKYLAWDKRGAELLRALNGYDSGSEPKAGDALKIVSDRP